MNEYMNQMLGKYGLSTGLDERVGIEFIDFKKTYFLNDDGSES